MNKMSTVFAGVSIAAAAVVGFAPSAFACNVQPSWPSWWQPTSSWPQPTSSWSPQVCPTGSALGVADQYTEFGSGSANRGAPGSTDDEGAVAYGGNAWFQNFYVGEFTGPSVSPGLDVAGLASGTVTMQSGAKGIIGLGQVLNPSNPSFPTNIVQSWLQPINFGLAALQQVSDSLTWGQEATTPGDTITQSGTVLTLSGSNPTLDVFDLAQGQFSTVEPINIDVPTTATVLINVPDQNIVDTTLNYIAYNGETGGQFNSPGTDALRNNTLFNFPDAWSLSLQNVAFAANILAPLANFTFNSGQLDGSVFAHNISGSFQANYTAPFTGCH